MHKATVDATAAGILKVMAEDHVNSDVWRRVPVAAMRSALADIAQEVAADV